MENFEKPLELCHDINYNKITVKKALNK